MRCRHTALAACAGHAGGRLVFEAALSSTRSTWRLPARPLSAPSARQSLCPARPAPPSKHKPMAHVSPSPPPHLRSLVERVRALGAAGRPQPGRPGGYDFHSLVALVALVKGLTQCVSSIHERRHEALVKEVLNIQLWAAHQVGGGWWVVGGGEEAVPAL